VSGARADHGGHDEPEEEKDGKAPTEFDCPSCNANNPCDALRDKDEVLCVYCGSAFEVRLAGGKMRLKDL
jgi:transcription elongation factor Elf1